MNTLDEAVQDRIRLARGLLKVVLDNAQEHFANEEETLLGSDLFMARMRLDEIQFMKEQDRVPLDEAEVMGWRRKKLTAFIHGET